MNDATPDGLDAALFSALPLALCLYGFNSRLLLATEAYSRVLGLPTDALRPGASFFETMQVLAYRGVFGPGDPEHQARALTEADRTQQRRLRRRYPDGRVLEIQFSPVPDGRLLLSVTDQTAWRERSDAAEASARRLNDIIEGLPLGVAVLDPALTLLLRNRRFIERLASPPGTLPVGISIEHLETLLHQDSAAAGGEPTTGSVVRGVLDGATASRAVLESGDLVELAGSRLPRGEWLLTLSDVSDRPGAEAEVLRRDRLNRAILDALPHGVCVCGPDRRVRMYNAAFSRLVGEHNIALGDEAARILDTAAFDPSHPQTLRRSRPDGSAFEVWLMPLPDAGFVCVSSGAASPALDGDDIRARAARLGALLAALPAGVLLWDASRRLAACNPRAGELLELPADRLTIGRGHSEFLTDLAARGAFGNAEDTGTRLRELLERDRSQPHIHRRANRAGRVLEVQSIPLADGGFVVTYTDVTEFRAAEANLRRARETVEAGHTARSRFLAMMSHELRTPLNAVIGYSEALAREATLAQERSGQEASEADGIAHFTRRAIEFANTINQAGHDLLTLVNNMIDVARIEAGRFDLASDRIELPYLISGCIRQASDAAGAGQVSIHADLAPDLPVLLADERRLRQTMIHLITNAINFTGVGGTVRIHAAIDPQGDLLISVSDTGIGIPEADQERVFEPFFQVDSGLARRTSGSGLGLYFSRALIGAHGGTLSLSSRPGEGTRVLIRMPHTRLVHP